MTTSVPMEGTPKLDLDSPQWASAPLFIVFLPLTPRDLANKMLCAPAPTDAASHTPTLVEVAAPPGPTTTDQAASEAVSPSCIPDSADVMTSPSLPTFMDEALELISDTRH